MLKKTMKLKMKDIIRYLGLLLLVLVFVNSMQKMYEKKPLIEGLFGEDDDDDEDEDEDEDEEEDDEDEDKDDFSGKEKKRLKKAARFIDKKIKGKKFKKKYNEDLKQYATTFAKSSPKKGKEMAQSLLNGEPLCAKGVSTALKKAAGNKVGGFF